MIVIGAATWFFTYFMYAFMIIYSERIIKKTRLAYLRAILAQESAWFDLTNPLELSSRIGKECLAIQKAIGEKVGTIYMALCMCVSGLAFAFSRGWSFALVVMGFFPFMAIVINF
jgi:ATP-binding cassette subfamily B (MDR/TAP) protein 1